MIKIPKKLYLKAAAVTAVFAMTAVPVCAAGVSFKFTLESKNEKMTTAAVQKQDNEQNAYVTLVEDVYDSYGNGDVLGVRVRDSLGNACTDYTLFKGYEKKVLPYTQIYGSAGSYYKLRGQVDESSAFNYLEVNGVWLP